MDAGARGGWEEGSAADSGSSQFKRAARKGGKKMKMRGWAEAAGAGQQLWELCSSSREWVMEMPQISNFHFKFSSF